MKGLCSVAYSVADTLLGAQTGCFVMLGMKLPPWEGWWHQRLA